MLLQEDAKCLTGIGEARPAFHVGGTLHWSCVLWGIHPPGEIHPAWGRLCGFTFYSISVDWSEGQYLSQQKRSEPSRTPSGLRGHAFRLVGPSLHAQLVGFVLRLCDTAMLIFDFNVVHQSLEWPPSSVLLHRGPQKLSFI